jgi:hypothetical protein
LYRKDLTNLGWPLPDDIRTSLRSGQGLPGTVHPAQGATSRVAQAKKSSTSTSGM